MNFEISEMALKKNYRNEIKLKTVIRFAAPNSQKGQKGLF